MFTSAAIMDFFAPYLVKIAVGGVIAIAAGGAFVGLKIHYQNVGYANAVAAIAAKDKGALDAVREATSRVDECYSRGRYWDVTSGVCS